MVTIARCTHDARKVAAGKETAEDLACTCRMEDGEDESAEAAVREP